MKNQGGLDKLEYIMPGRGAPLRADIKRVVSNPHKSETLVGRDSVYAEMHDFRRIGIPILLARGNKFHASSGPRVSIVGVGEMPYSRIVEVSEAVFDCDVQAMAEPTRTDLTADVKDVESFEFGRMLYAPLKRTGRQIKGGEEYGTLTEAVQRGRAMSYYFGQRPMQWRVYDKTFHRLKVLLPDMNKERERYRLSPLTFEEAFGYSPFQVVTRIERAMGDREAAKRWGIAKLGDLPKLMNFDPFENLRFIADAKGTAGLENLDAVTRGYIKLLRRMNEDVGLDQTRAFIKGQYATGDPTGAARQFWRKYQHLIIKGGSVVTRNTLLDTFRDAYRLQLAA